MNSGPFLIMFAAGLWAVDALIRTPLTRSFGAASIVFLEHVVGLFVLSPFLVRHLVVFRKLTMGDWIRIVLLTLVSSVGGTVLFTEALSRSFSVGDFVTPLLLQKTQPLIVITLSALFLKENLPRRFLLLVPVAMLGSYLMSFGTLPLSLQLSGRELVFLLALGAAAAWGSGTILSKLILKKCSPMESTGLRFLAAVPLSALTAAALHQLPTVQAMTAGNLLRFVLIALTTGAVALLLYYRGLARTEARVSTISELSFPLVSILIAVTPLNPYGAAQVLSTANIVGIILLLGAVLWVSLEHAAATARTVVTGTVVRGAGDGRKLGFPTANIALSGPLSLPYGVYASVSSIGNRRYPGIVHYGPRLVFGQQKPQFEVHLFDLNKNLYGKTLATEIRQFIRPTERFPSVEAMVVQIHEDIRKAEKILNNDLGGHRH